VTYHNFLSADARDHHFIFVLRSDLELGKEFVEDIGYFLGFVLVDGVAYIVNDHKLEFALHLSDCEIFVHPVAACK
jgi:hypothetical protein